MTTADIAVDTRPRADFTVEPTALQGFPALLSPRGQMSIPTPLQIQIEPPTILPPGTELRPIREVVLPASVVLAWSLFGLIGIATSFLAGLFIGHFFWVMH